MSKTLDSRILNVFEELSPSEQRLADVVLEHLCLLKIPSAAEILAFGRIGVRSGHA